jgi:hypothetical protein
VCLFQDSAADQAGSVKNDGKFEIDRIISILDNFIK